jgi:hypothetical protein
MRTATKHLLLGTLLVLLWAGSAHAYVRFGVENHGATLDPAYVQEVTTLISDIHKSFINALRLRVTSDVQVTLKFYKEQTEYQKDARSVWNADLSTVPPAFFRHYPMEVWAMQMPDRRLTTMAILHESTHMFVHNLAEDCPIWIHEGMAESFQWAQLKKGRFVLLHWPYRDDRIKKMLAAGQLPNLGEYMDQDRKTWQTKDDKGEQVREVSWALVWFLLSSDEGRQLLNDLIRAHQPGRRPEPSSALIDRYWRGGLKALEAAWRAWIPGQRTPQVMDIPSPTETSLTTLVR